MWDFFTGGAGEEANIKYYRCSLGDSVSLPSERLALFVCRRRRLAVGVLLGSFRLTLARVHIVRPLASYFGKGFIPRESTLMYVILSVGGVVIVFRMIDL